MNDNQQQPAEPLERGRYALYETGQGLVIARASGICQTCQECGCGTARDKLELPPIAVKIAKGEQIGPADVAGLLAGSGLSPIKGMRGLLGGS